MRQGPEVTFQGERQAGRDPPCGGNGCSPGEPCTAICIQTAEKSVGFMLFIGEEILERIQRVLRPFHPLPPGLYVFAGCTTFFTMDLDGLCISPPQLDD